MQCKNIWRIHIRPSGISPQQSVEWCLKNNVVGFGWSLNQVPSDKDEAYLMAKSIYPNSKSWKKAFNALLWYCSENDLIWMRDTNGCYHLGRITGDWFYDNSNEARKMDVVNVRPCLWTEVGTMVPGKIVSCFRPSATIQRMNSFTIKMYSMLLANEKIQKSHYNLNRKSLNFFDLLDDSDTEDLVALYIQYIKEYLLVPSTEAGGGNTIHYEFEFINRNDGSTAIVQVKTGNVTLDRNDYSTYIEKNINGKVFLFTASEKYFGKENDRIICIRRSELERFISSYTFLMPDNIKYWINYVKKERTRGD